jgi:hypothetical protein
MLKLEDIETKTHLTGIEPAGAVRVIDIETRSRLRTKTRSARLLRSKFSTAEFEDE